MVLTNLEDIGQVSQVENIVEFYSCRKEGWSDLRWEKEKKLSLPRFVHEATFQIWVAVDKFFSVYKMSKLIKLKKFFRNVRSF